MWKKKQIVRKKEERRKKKRQDPSKLGGIPPNLRKVRYSKGKKELETAPLRRARGKLGGM